MKRDVRPQETGVRQWSRALCCALVACLLPIAPGTSVAGAAPPAGSDAPPISLPDVTGARVEVAALAPGTKVLIFGNLEHHGVLESIWKVMEVVTAPHRPDSPVTTILISADEISPDVLSNHDRAATLPAIVLVDRERQAFGAYRIFVMPTVVVVNAQGRVVHSFAGPTKRFQEDLAATLRFSAGEISREQFQQAIDQTDRATSSPEQTRADRLIHLGQELARHGLYENAELRFNEAIDIAPERLEGRLGLADVLLQQGRTDEAEAAYRVVLKADSESLDAAIGIATIQALKGGESLREAEATADKLVAQNPSMAKVRYLRGFVYEQKGNCSAALAEFKYAAQLLLKGG